MTETAESQISLSEVKVIGIVRVDEYGYRLQIINGAANGWARLSPKHLQGAGSSMLVIARLTEPIDMDNLQAEVVEVLGSADDSDNAMQAIYKLYNVETEFGEAVVRAAKRIPASLSPTVIAKELAKGRIDLRTLPTLTIDGVDSKDLDDAISIELLPDGNRRLYVHIADVTHYVTEDGAIDTEAMARGTSIYPVDRVIPMLPVSLSNGICSLNVGVDRFALTVTLDYDRHGKRIAGDVFTSIIKSDLRADYQTVYKILVTGKAEGDYLPFLVDLQNLAHLAKKIAAVSERKGRFDFDFPETKIDLDPQGRPVKIYPYQTTFANRMIEEFMVAANEFVAEKFAKLAMPFLYRVHGEPDLTKLSLIMPLVKQLDKSIFSTFLSDRVKQATFLRSLAGKPQAEIIGSILLRAMAKAIYDYRCLGHYGLALKYYCHFTSPIRRYPDLFIHRVIKGYLQGKVHSRKWRKKAESLAISCSALERQAVAVERATCDLKIAEYMSSHLGEVYLARISGFNNAGIFVRLPNTVEGLIPFRTMNDYYSYTENQFWVKGERSGKVWQVGDFMQVQVASVDRLRNRIDFSLVKDEDTKGRAYKKRSSKLEHKKDKQQDNQPSHLKNKSNTKLKRQKAKQNKKGKKQSVKSTLKTKGKKKAQAKASSNAHGKSKSKPKKRQGKAANKM